MLSEVENWLGVKAKNLTPLHIAWLVALIPCDPGVAQYVFDLCEPS